MYLTKKRTLEICRDLWQWMKDEEHYTSNEKPFWPEWKQNGGPIPDSEANCPCCEYLRRRGKNTKGQDCKSCPLVGYAWGYNPDIDFSCFTVGSPYIPFCNNVGTPADAQKIIDACNEALKDLKQ